MQKSVVLAALLLAGAASVASADPLIEAVRAGDGQEAIRLIEGGAQVNAADPLGTTARSATSQHRADRALLAHRRISAPPDRTRPPA